MLWKVFQIKINNKFLIHFIFLFFVVLAPPEITVEKSWVHAGEGYESQLICTVHGEANPVVSLFIVKEIYSEEQTKYFQILPKNF